MHSTNEYRAAMEVELWKQQQKKLFRENLQAKETDLLEKYSLEFAKREKARASQFEERYSALSQLNGEVKRLAASLETREAKLFRAEEELQQRSKELEREHSQLLSATRDSARRLQEEYAHKLSLAKMQVDELKDSLLRAVDDKNDKENLLRRLQMQLDEQKALASAAKTFGLPKDVSATEAYSSETVKAEAEVKHLKERLVDLTSKLDASEKLNAQYKADLIKAISALEQLKRRLQKQQKVQANVDAEHAKLKALYSALSSLTPRESQQTSRSVVKTTLEEDQKLLGEIKGQLKTLIEQTQRQQQEQQEQQQQQQAIAKAQAHSKLSNDSVKPSPPISHSKVTTPHPHPRKGTAVARRPVQSTPPRYPVKAPRSQSRSQNPAYPKTSERLEISGASPKRSEAVVATDTRTYGQSFNREVDFGEDADIFDILSPSLNVGGVPTADLTNDNTLGHDLDDEQALEECHSQIDVDLATPSEPSLVTSSGVSSSSGTLCAETATLELLRDFLDLKTIFQSHAKAILLVNKSSSVPVDWKSVAPKTLINLVIPDKEKLRELLRVLTERNGLLATGIYVREDRLIKDFEARIKFILENSLSRL